MLPPTHSAPHSAAPSVTIEQTARRICEDQWRVQITSHKKPPSESPICPVSWLLPDLLMLLVEHHDRPVHELAPMIRRLIEDQDFSDQAGDPMIEAAHDEQIDEYVRLFVRSLEQVRRDALTRGEWSDLPVTPQMFG